MCTGSLGGGRRPARQRASSDPRIWLGLVRISTASRLVGSDRLLWTVPYGRDLEDVAVEADCQFGWLQGTRNLLGQSSFWLQRPDLTQLPDFAKAFTSSYRKA